MNYKINIKCNISLNDDKNISSIKEKIMNLNNNYLKSNEKVAYYYEDINTGSILSYNSDILLIYSYLFLELLVLLEISEKILVVLVFYSIE